MSLLKPSVLKPGDRVAVVAPASPFDREDFNEGIAELQRLGFDPIYDERVFDEKGYVAGNAESRATALRTAWLDPSIAGLIAVRGGFGSAHLLPLLNKEEIRKSKKAFLGYSDLTSLLVFLTINCGVVSFHAPMLASNFGRGKNGYDYDSFFRCLMRCETVGEFSPPGLQTLIPGESSGILVGGTLSQLVASLGTPFAFIPPIGAILFLDEIGEAPYRIDRMLTQLRHSEILDRVSAIVFGELPQCDNQIDGLEISSRVVNLLSGFSGPVLFGFPSGHTVGSAFTLPFGVQSRVVADNKPRLIIEEAAVE